MKEPVKLSPFKHLCMTIGNLPSSYVDSMSYYECLLWLINYLQKTVIPALNNNAEAVKEIQDWIATLDLQDEVDNKLDEMAESGQLQEIISEYLNSKAIFGYDTVNDMKEATNLIDGSFVRTLGYHSKNDGGSSLYKIRTITNQDVIDNGSIVAMNNENLVAELITNVSNIMSFGAYGDGNHDDFLSINNAINYAKNKNIKLYSPGGKIYLISETINITNMNVDFNSSTLKSNNNIDLITINSDSSDFYSNGIIKNIKFDCNNICNSAINLNNSRKQTIKDIEISNITNYGIYYNSGFENLIENVRMTGSTNGINNVGIYLNGADSHFNNIIMMDLHTAIHTTNRLNYLNNIHAWILTPSLLQGSKFVRITGKCILYMDNSYSDTYETSFSQDSYEGSVVSPIIRLNNLTVIFNRSIYSQEHNPTNPYVFRMISANDTVNITLTSSNIEGNWATGISTGFCNVEEYINLNGTTMSHVIASLTYQVTVSDPLYTVKSNKIKRNGNVIDLDLVLSYDSSAVSTGTKTIGVLPSLLTPVEQIKTVAFVSDSEWGTSSYNTVLCTIDTNSNILARIKNGTGTQYLYLHITYIRQI